MWQDVRSQVKRLAGSSGAVSIPLGSHVLSISAHSTAGGSVAIWDGAGGVATIPIPANTWFVYDPKHLCTTANTGSATITFTTTDSYLVEISNPQGF
jgi:hypothetical protein